MPSIFKYIPAQYVANFLRGEVLFRSLSYFRDYEEKQVRGDLHEGTRLHRKPAGLETTNTTTGEKTVIPYSFESSAKGEDIFVFCLSTALSASLAHDFKTNTCIEIHSPAHLIGGIRSALNRRPSVKSKTVLHASVRYYEAGEDPIVDWALPDKIAMSKLRSYESQQEYRIAFAMNDALRIENTSLLLVPLGSEAIRTAVEHPEMLLKVGDLRRRCTVWEFGRDGMPVTVGVAR
jgi:hypothetical protein